MANETSNLMPQAYYTKLATTRLLLGGNADTKLASLLTLWLLKWPASTVRRMPISMNRPAPHSSCLPELWNATYGLARKALRTQNLEERI